MDLYDFGKRMVYCGENYHSQYQHRFQIFKSAQKGWRKKVGVKLYGLFLQTELFKRNSKYLSIIPLLDFSENLNTSRNCSAFYVSAHLRV